MKHLTFEHSQFSPCSRASIPIYVAHSSPGDTIYWAQPNWLTQTAFLNTSVRSQPCKHGALDEITVPRIHIQHWPVQCLVPHSPASVAPWTLACAPVPKLHFPLCQWSAHNPVHILLSLPSPPIPGCDKCDHSSRYPSDVLLPTLPVAEMMHSSSALRPQHPVQWTRFAMHFIQCQSHLAFFQYH